MPLFDPNLVYPQDRTGVYADLEGVVTAVGEPLGNDVLVTVETDRGVFLGWTYVPLDQDPVVKIGYLATIRVYDAGGGFYPDNRIVSWRHGT